MLNRTNQIGRCTTCKRKLCTHLTIKHDHPEEGCFDWTSSSAIKAMRKIPLISVEKVEDNDED